MPEVPSNMQDGIANLEIEARTRQQRQSNPQAPSAARSPYVNQYEQPKQPQSNSRQNSKTTNRQRSGDNYKGTNASAYQDINKAPVKARQDEPSDLSPFPKLRDPGPNVPLSDDEKEDVLERARPLVLQSTDPEMQLAWAQDALAWVEAAGQAYLRLTESGLGPSRPSTPKVEHQLRVDAMNIVNYLADQGHPKADFMRGMWLEFGKFANRVDKKEAFLAYRRAAEKGYARAEYRIGMQFESTNNSSKATDHYLKGVELGDSASNYRLGMMTLLGQHGMTQNYQHGIELIRLAADTADENAPQGAYVYGMLLARELPNISVPEEYLPYDLVDAKLFIEKAAYLGFAKAQLKMAQAYELCQLGCDFEPTLSLHYNALAARQGESEADMAISKWFLCGYEGIFEKNEKLAYEYARRAAAAKNSTAEFAMGYFYEIGMTVPKNLEESEKWYRLAEEHGNKDAIGRINSIKQNKALSKDDHEKVAISRIKSQYGSQRGQRPDRFRNRPSPMPSMNEDRSETPRGRRPASAAPYPENDVGSQHQLRPNSPYRQQGLRPNVGPAADRPMSAFGFRTPENPAYPPPTDQIRPSSSMSNMVVQGGRGNNYGPGRPLSAWDSPQQLAKQRAPSPGPSGPSRPPKQPLNKSHPQGPGQAPGTGYGHDQQPQQQYPINNGFASMSNVTPRRDPAIGKFTRPERNSSMPVSPVLVSPRTDSFQNQSRASMRPTQDSRHSSISSATMSPPSAPPKVAEPPAAAHPPKKTGPATFEEMGIPQAKTEDNCVSIYAVRMSTHANRLQVIM